MRITLTTKALWLPAAILLVIFIVTGSVFSWLISQHTDELTSHELTQLLRSERENLSIGLSLVTATAGPADAVIGLDGEDEELARDLVKQVSRMGLDTIYISDLNGKQLFSTGEEMPAELREAAKNSNEQQRLVHHLNIDGNMVAFTPIIDVDTPTGYLFFSVKLDDKLFAYANKTHESNDGQVSLASERLTRAERELKTTSASFLAEVLMAIAVTLVVGLVIVVAVLGTTTRNIVRLVHDLLGLLNKMAKGDFTERAQLKGNDELTQLQHAVNATAEQLREMIGALTDSTEELDTSASQIANLIEASSRGSNTQKAETEQVATAMNQMAATIQEIARATGTAAGAADQANREAENGNQVVSGTIESITNLAAEVEKASVVIDELRQNSDDIGTVLEVIRGIAEQTNLLALNAAIEAARAGEQGRGFAVVADEVRTLAGRTQQSTEEIQSMIERLQGGTRDAVKVMRNGRDRAQGTVDQARQAGESLVMITGSAAEISGMNTQIASAAEELGAAAEEVNRKVVSINQIADQTADNAVEIVTAGQSLNSLSQTLRTMTGRFTL